MTADERPPSSDEMIRLAREATAPPPAPSAGLKPTPEPEARAAPVPISDAGRRLLASRRRPSRVDTPAATGPAGPEPSRNARTLAALVIAIALIGLGLAIFVAMAASAP